MKIENNCFYFILLFQLFNRKAMFAEMNSNINSLGSALLHLTSQPNSLMGSALKVKDGIISETKSLATFSVDQYTPYKPCSLRY
jgi:hypothetical protein